MIVVWRWVSVRWSRGDESQDGKAGAGTKGSLFRRDFRGWFRRFWRGRGFDDVIIVEITKLNSLEIFAP